MSAIEYGSIQVKSPVMLELFNEIAVIDPSDAIYIIGEKGCGKKMFAQHLKRLLSKTFSGEMNIVTMTTDEWIEKSNAGIAHTHKVIMMPSLCQRRADLIPLAEFFLQVLSLMNNSQKVKLTEKAIEKILHYEWPGQFYEFEDVLENAFMKAEHGLIEPELLTMRTSSVEVGVPVGMKLDELERKYILQTLYFVHQNRTKAAELLGISIRTLRNKINQYRIEGYL